MSECQEKETIKRRSNQVGRRTLDWSGAGATKKVQERLMREPPNNSLQTLDGTSPLRICGNQSALAADYTTHHV